MKQDLSIQEVCQIPFFTTTLAESSHYFIYLYIYVYLHFSVSLYFIPTSIHVYHYLISNYHFYYYHIIITKNVDDAFAICDNEDLALRLPHCFNLVHLNLKFTSGSELHNKITFLDFRIARNKDSSVS